MYNSKLYVETKNIMLCIVVLCLALFGSPPTVVAAPLMTSTDGPTDDQNFQLWPQRLLAPATVDTLVMISTGGPTENRNFRPSSPHDCHCGHRAEVTKSNPTEVYTTAGHWHVHSTTVAETDQATDYTSAGCRHDITDANHATGRCPNHHNQPQQGTPNSTPSPVDNSVTEDISNRNYDESGDDFVDDDFYPLHNIVVIILLVMFVLLYPSFYLYSTRRKQNNVFYLQTNSCGCKAKYIRCY